MHSVVTSKNKSWPRLIRRYNSLAIAEATLQQLAAAVPLVLVVITHIINISLYNWLKFA